MSHVNPRLVYWIKAVTSHPDFTDGQKLVLITLATDCLDFSTGAGYCSVKTLRERTGKGRTVVIGALELARKAGLIEQTKRGHRLTDNSKIASEWQVIYPPMPTGTRPPVGPKPTSPPRDLGPKPKSGYADVGSAPKSGYADLGSEPRSGFEQPKVRISETQGPATRTPTGNEVTTGNEAPPDARAREAEVVPVVTGTVVAKPGGEVDLPSRKANPLADLTAREQAEVARLLMKGSGSAVAVYRSQMKEGDIVLTIAQAKANLQREDLLAQVAAELEASQAARSREGRARRETCHVDVTDETRFQGYGATPPQRPCGEPASHLHRLTQSGVCTGHLDRYPDITLTPCEET